MGRRAALEICGSPDRPTMSGATSPCIRKKAVLRAGRRRRPASGRRAEPRWWRGARPDRALAGHLLRYRPRNGQVVRRHTPRCRSVRQLEDRQWLHSVILWLSVSSNSEAAVRLQERRPTEQLASTQVDEGRLRLRMAEEQLRAYDPDRLVTIAPPRAMTFGPHSSTQESRHHRCDSSPMAARAGNAAPGGIAPHLR